VNHTQCKIVSAEDKHEPQGNKYFKIYRYFYCQHGEVVSNEFIDNYVEGNIAGAYQEEWGKHG
jgi:hypothetical protein